MHRKNMLTVENERVKTILCSAKKSTALSRWLSEGEAGNDNDTLRLVSAFNTAGTGLVDTKIVELGYRKRVRNRKKGKKNMSKKSKKTSSKNRTSAAMKSKTASVVDIGQFFNNPIKMENFMSQGKNQFDKLSNEANSLGRDGFEAFNKSFGIFSKGFEELIRASVAIAQSAAEKQSQLIKDAMTVKSLSEFSEVQNRIAQSNFDDGMAALQKLSDMSVKLLSQASEPINAQMAKGMKKAQEAMAA